MSGTRAEQGTAAGDPLGRPVRALFEALEHAGEPAVAPAGGRLQCGEAGRAALGTHVRFYLRLEPHGAGCRILEARYRAYGCPHTLATCEWLARRLSGCSLPAVDAAALTQVAGAPVDWAQALGVPQAKLGRLLVVEDALRAALLSCGSGGATAG